MKIKLKEIGIKEITKGYEDRYEEGVQSFDGKLDIRPKYQREFVYDIKQQKAVIETVLKDFPLNVMYWVKKNKLDDEYEVLDGQQRTLSICEFIKGNYDIEIDGHSMYFHSLTQDEQDKILNYKLMIYQCEGTDKEKLDWFKTINIAGEKLTNQELRNAVYTGEWLSDAKRFFSKTGCIAYQLSSKYVKGTPIRQDYLEIALKWISEDKIQEYMSRNQNKENANELKLYFRNVINWIETIFPNYRKEMKGIDWGSLYNDHKDTQFDSQKIEEEITKLMQDEDVSKLSGIYFYVITRNEKYLNIRAFTDKQKRESYERQEGICPHCKDKFKIEEMEGDHITPWCEGGKTNIENLQMLCKPCNRFKSSN